MTKLLLNGDIPVNCYIIEHNNKCYIVDPGYEKEVVQNYIAQHNLEVLGILLTHGHIDHIGAIDAFDVPVYVHEKEKELLCDNHKNGFAYYGKEIPYNIDSINLVTINDGYTLALDNKIIDVIHTPGHTVGGVCYKIDNDLYTGDTLFEGSVGRWDFPTGDEKTLMKTVVKLIDTQDDSINIHPGHGESSSIGKEKKNNYFYLSWKEIN